MGTNYPFLTSKERDIETGLNYFGASILVAFQGRFTGVDSADADWANPQTLNKYQYCLNDPLAKVDRDGRYEEDVHRDLTLALAMAAGFNPAASAVIAGANQSVDDNPETSPMGMLPWGRDVEVRRLYHFTSTERRQEMWNDFAGSGSLQKLGMHFHAQQDSYSHAGFGARTGHARPSLGDMGHRFDKTYNFPDKANTMAYDTFVRMQSALFVAFRRGTVKEIYSAVDWKVIAPLVDAFNRAGTAEQKKQLIAQIVAKAAEHPAQQMRAREDARRKKEEKRKKQER